MEVECVELLELLELHPITSTQRPSPSNATTPSLPTFDPPFWSHITRIFLVPVRKNFIEEETSGIQLIRERYINAPSNPLVLQLPRLSTSHTMAQNCHFKSKSTNYYVTSTKQDKDKGDVVTVNGANSVPPDTVRSPLADFCLSNFFPILFITFKQILTVTASSAGIFTITGVSGLYISLSVSLHLYILLMNLIL